MKTDAEICEMVDALRVRVQSLTPDAKRRYLHAADECIKDPDLYATLCYSTFFLHHFYLRENDRGFAALFAMVAALVVVIVGVCIKSTVLGATGVAGLILTVGLQLQCLLQSERIVKFYNVNAQNRVLSRLREEGRGQVQKS